MDDAGRPGFDTEVQLAAQAFDVELGVVVERRHRDGEDPAPAGRSDLGAGGPGGAR
jgi:hypothetical protein